jgi:HlyD family secretion protein
MVEAAEASRGPMRVTVEEEGKTRLRQRYVVYSPVTGHTRRLPFDVGDPVKQGQVLAVLDPVRPAPLDPRTEAEARAAVASAAAQVEAAEQRVGAAKANAEYWQTEAERVTRLAKSGDVARSRYDQTVTEQQRAQAALGEAQHTLESARAELRRAEAAVRQYRGPASNPGNPVTVSAPTSGRVLRLMHQSAGVVNAGEPLLEIGNAKAIEVEVEVLSPDAVKLAPGTPVLFTRWGGEETLEGVVERLEPTGVTKISALGVEEQRVPVIAVITSPESLWSRLGAGYRVEASFILWEGKNVLQVPTSSLFRYGDQPALFVIQENIARRRIVQTGRRTGLQTEITGGLEPGEQVITHPDESIEDGTAVQVRQAAR